MYRSKISAWRGAALVGGLAALMSADGLAQTYTCATARDAQAAHLYRYIVRLVTAPSSDSILVATRTAYSLPSGSSALVSLEKSKTTCRLAAEAYHRELYGGAPPISRVVVVIKVGNTRYVVLDDQERGGEFQIHVVFDASWTKLATFTG